MTLIRLLNLMVVAALVLAAAYVYNIKFEATLQATQVSKLRDDIRREHDAIAALRAEWSRLDNPDRIQRITSRHLPLQQIDATQIDTLDHLPMRPPEPGSDDQSDPIATIIENGAFDGPTGSIGARVRAR
jgi:hypothetical protein